MRTIRGSVLVCLTFAAAAACSGMPTEGSPVGTAGAPGASGSGGRPSSPEGGGTGGTSTGGAGGGVATGSGGAGGAGGVSGGGPGGGSGSPSSPAPDAAPATPATGPDAGPPSAPPAGGNGDRPVVPSAGCGKMGAPSGARTILTGGQMGAFNVNVPAGYNPTRPMPLGFGFHGFSNPACGPNQGECRGFAMLPAVTVYMKSFTDGWEQPAATLEQNVRFFQDVLAQMKNEYCIDENRIFIAGVSSGGQFIETLTCRFGDTFWQVTPVSAGVVRSATMNCKGTPPILIIGGITDPAGGFGEEVAALFARRNGCSATAPAGLAAAKTRLMAAFTAMDPQHVCLDWEGCTANPVRFCLSSQITYDGRTHGWPRVGGQLISEFQATIK